MIPLELTTAKAGEHMPSRCNLRNWMMLAMCTIFPAQAAVASEVTNQRLLAANNASDAAMRNAWLLYTQRKFGGAADGFESLLASQPPSARLYYYAALANREAGRQLRAKQLFEYIAAHFAKSQEATYAQQQLHAKSSVAAKPAATDDLPESVKNALPPEMQAMLGTEAGRLAVKQVLQQQGQNIEVVRQAEAHGGVNKRAVVSAMLNQTPTKGKGGTEYPFTAADIARDGAAGIDQSANPNCWFEASMAALAELPRGQKLIASMIRVGKNGGYVVRFPGDGVEYNISDQELAASEVQDKAKWASILECAQLQKFPDNAGANGADNDQSRLEVGLGSITGRKAELLAPSKSEAQEVSRFISGAVKSQNPIVAGTFPSQVSMPIVSLHAYTIIGFDPSRSLITIRNPHGSHSQKFELFSDPHHLDFEQMEDGVFKMSIPMFQKCFSQVARSFI